MFAEIRGTLRVSMLAYVHEAEQCARDAQAVDVLRILAVLFRQADLLIAAAKALSLIHI